MQIAKAMKEIIDEIKEKFDRKIGHINVLDDDYSAISSIVGQEQTRFLSP